ncbi:TA system antitoxin ParD family protein [Williamsia sp.]|uniref:TA system antitoxin ParD family protein n=1 Tax=Williamsia sp. TaxID=1872085 RepID=UPI002F94A56C
MARTADKVTRFDAELVDSAIAEGERQQRTGRQQLEHWARVGRAMTAHETAPLAKVRAALAGDVPLEDLTAPEGAVFNAEIRAAIAENLAEADYRKTLAERGVTTVSTNDKGELVEYRPDGSQHILDAG